jgi:hypothetical protein
MLTIPNHDRQIAKAGHPCDKDIDGDLAHVVPAIRQVICAVAVKVPNEPERAIDQIALLGGPSLRVEGCPRGRMHIDGDLAGVVPHDCQVVLTIRSEISDKPEHAIDQVALLGGPSLQVERCPRGHLDIDADLIRIVPYSGQILSAIAVEITVKPEHAADHIALLGSPPLLGKRCSRRRVHIHAELTGIVPQSGQVISAVAVKVPLEPEHAIDQIALLGGPFEQAG